MDSWSLLIGHREVCETNSEISSKIERVTEVQVKPPQSVSVCVHECVRACRVCVPVYVLSACASPIYSRTGV